MWVGWGGVGVGVGVGVAVPDFYGSAAEAKL